MKINLLLIIGEAVVVCVLLFVLTVLPVGTRQTGSLENTSGIPYPTISSTTVVTQTLAHIDVYLRESVAFKRLVVSFEYLPKDVRSLSLGVRENSFWLSYQPTVFFSAAGPAPRAFIPVTLTFPLTDKLQEIDRSIDVMFITNGVAEAYLNDPVSDPTHWEIKNLQVRTEYAWPTWAAVKNYGRSILWRERAL